ncbi:FACT complex subunit SSRP1 [Picochlorum sp. SENEW3]|nr:FACT complex subunit SSRP1 [Picochlorum sp. SENEW3]
MVETERSEVLTGVAMGTRGGVMEGSIQLSSKGIVWKRSGGGKTVEVASDDIKRMMWTEMPRIENSTGVKSTVLVVIRKDANGSVNFIGFPKSKLAALQTMGLGEAKETKLTTKGANWGSIEMQGANVIFKNGDMPVFVVPLSDVLQAQHGREEVTVQLPVDDQSVDRNDDALAGLSFYVPKACEDFGKAEKDGEELPASKKFYDVLKSYTMDVGAGDIIASFDSVGVQLPRGRFDVEMYPSSFHLLGQAHDFRVQYSSILRIFILPRSNAPQTIVAVALDPPLRKGQTTYPMVLCQFHNDEEMTIDLQLSEESLKKLNDKGAKLTKEMTGPSPDVFAKTLRGLSGAKLTRNGAFRDATGEGHAVRCSYKNDDGHLYPLERAFFYLLKPPMLIPYDDIRSVEFMRQTTGISAAKTFDLLIKMKGVADDVREQQYLFRSIPRSEWTNLFEWIQAKDLRVENLKEVQNGPSAPSPYGEGMVGIDPALAAIDAQESDEDEYEEPDEDFEASESESDGDDSVLSDEEGAPDVVPETKPKRSKPVSEREGGKKKRKKKDKNAPKKALSAFMCFSNSVREKVKEDNPGIAFTDVAKRIGEMWKELSDADKAPYEAMANEDKERYAKEMAAYNAGQTEAKQEEPKEEVKTEQEDFSIKDEP